MKALRSTFSTSTPNLCLNCDEGGKKSEKNKRGVADESKKRALPIQDGIKTENDTVMEQEHLLTE